MSHKQCIKEFCIPDEQYQPNNIEGWALSKEPTSLKELTNAYSVDVERLISAYIQQVIFHAQLNVNKYKAQNPDILGSRSTRKKTIEQVLVGLSSDLHNCP